MRLRENSTWVAFVSKKEEKWALANKIRGERERERVRERERERKGN